MEIFAALDPIAIANEAAEKGFRWWFLALLLLVLGAGLWALKYLLSMVTELSTSRQHHHDRLAAMQSESLNMVREVVAVVASTRAVIESNTRESATVRQAIERWERDHK